MADAPMKFLGEHDGVKWYWAEPDRFTTPGVYYWNGKENVHVAAQPERVGEWVSDEPLSETWLTAVAKDCGISCDRLSQLFDFAGRVQRATVLALRPKMGADGGRDIPLAAAPQPDQALAQPDYRVMWAEAISLNQRLCSALAQPPAQQEPVAPAALALRFHETYERLAPQFGYETRTETRKFDPQSDNGRLMTAVAAEILQGLAHPSQATELSDAERRDAERYRWLRAQGIYGFGYDGFNYNEDIDRIADAAIAAFKREKT